MPTKKHSATLRELMSKQSQRASKTARQDDSEQLVKTTYYLRREQARAIKARAAKEGRFVSDLARDALDAYLRR